MEYTKGKWNHVGDGAILAGDYQIASVSPTNRKANAQLIAAAPELYEACRAMLPCLHPQSQERPYKLAQKALAKAKGA